MVQTTITIVDPDMRRPPNLTKNTTAIETKAALANSGPPANYLDLYGLSKPPFGEAHDRTGYILFGSHKRAFELLIEHVVNGAGVVLLQGEEGVGKTATLRSAATIAAESGLQTILISRPPNGRINLKQLVSAMQGHPGTNETTAEDAIEHFLAPPRKALLVDDFDLMPDDCVRLISSLTRRLPNEPGVPAIVLSSSSGLPSATGRPPSSKPAGLPRNTIRIPRLGPAEVQQYIERSLWMSGGTTRRLISPDAMKLLVARSGGVPGIINRLMEAAFTAGFARGDSMITAKTLAAAMGPTPSRPSHRQSMPSRVTERAIQIVATGLLVLGASVFLYKGLTGQPDRPPAPALVKQADQLLGLIRQSHQRAAEAGYATAATALGKTYDPAYAPAGSNADPARAAEWYRKAITLGDPQAANLLKNLDTH